MLTPRRPYLTSRAHAALNLAHELADRLGHEDISPSHVVIGVLREARNPAAAMLQLRGLDPAAVASELAEQLRASTIPREPPAERAWTPADNAFVDMAMHEAGELGTEFYGPEHLFLGVLHDETTVPAQVFNRHGLSYDEAKADLVRFYAASSLPPELRSKGEHD